MPPVFGIGFVGQQAPVDETLCRAAILAFLAEQSQNESPHRSVYGKVALSGMAGLLCAECCTALGLPVQIYLPADRATLRSSFDPEDLSRLEHVLQTAIGEVSCGSDGPQLERLYECGVTVAQQCEITVAIWDGNPGNSEDSTDELVDCARALERSVVRLHCVTGAVETVSPGGGGDHDAELDFLNGLPPRGVCAGEDSPKAIVCAWRSNLSANASEVAPKVRRLAAIPILCTALAAVISGAAPRIHMKLVWTGLGVVLGLAAALLPVALRLGKRQALWVRIRTAAEVTRSVLAIWDAPIAYEIVGPEVLPELAGMVRALNLLKARANRNETPDPARFKQKYHEERVLDQMKYFSAQAKQASSRGKRYRALSRVCIVAAIAISVFSFVTHHFLKPNSALARDAWIGLLTSALFQAATVAGALLVVNDCDRRERRYKELHRSLTTLDAELLAFRTWPLINQVVGKIERCLLVELIEWRSLLQNRKMPRN